jgi:N-acetyl-gamma-glutamyl-phosphate reductase
MQVYAGNLYTDAITPTTSVAIIGATGYAGATAASLLEGHPHAHLTRVTSRSYAGRRLSDAWPAATLDLQLHGEADPGDAEVVVVALPHGMAGGLAGKWLDEGRTVVDLGADFRLRDPEEYKRWYGADHPASALLAQAVSGLPELSRPDLNGAKLIACPGCYSTAAILALLPAARSALARADFVVDAASGVSGAGRSLALGYHFAEAAEDYRAYGIEGHRHQPEIVQAFRSGSSAPTVTFVPHLVPMVRGILATCYFDLVEGATLNQLKAAYVDAYKDEPFVHIVEAPPHTKQVAGTNNCLVHVTQQNDKAIVIAAIDNLVKGAAGQGVQALNVAMGWPETAGLQQPVRWP